MKKTNLSWVGALLVFALLLWCTAATPGTIADPASYAPAVYSSMLSLLPPVVAIVLALNTKEVYTSLLVGIATGALLFANGNLELALNTLFFNEDGGMVAKLSDSSNVGILVFLVMLGILVALMNKAGGSAAFGRWASTHIHTRAGAQFATLILGTNKTSPFEFYQYWRNVGDSDVMKCIRMLTFLPLEQIDEMSTWKDQRLNEAKEILAFELTKMVHGEEEAAKAQNAARALFSGAAGDAEHMPNTQLTEADLTDGSIGILTLMVKAGLAASNGEARRLVVQGGVLVDGEKVAAPTVSFTAEQLSKGIVIKKGKKVYHKVSL